MKYSNYVVQLKEAANSTKQLKHLSHLEDLMFEEGSSALPNIISSMEAFLSVIHERKFTGKTKLTTKWDGSPSVIIHDKNGDFWVASKSAFNKDPKFNRTDEDIERNHGHAPGLVEKLKYALKYCRDLGINGIVQGDFLYTDGDLKVESIYGEENITFKPNTITYAIPTKTSLGKRILASKMGIIIHTEYDDSFNTKNVGTYSVAKLRKSKDVFFDDALIKDVTESISLTQKENEEIMKVLSRIKSLATSIPHSFLDDLANHEEIAPLMAKYNNANVRAGSYANPSVVKGFSSYIDQEFEKEKSKLKTEKAKQAREQKKSLALKFIESNMSNLVKAYELYSDIVYAKLVILGKLNKITSSVKSFMLTDNGFEVTPVEGFVAVHDGKVFKLVDRLEFSAKNFANRPRTIKEQKSFVEFKSLIEAKSNCVVLCFGRSNPPHLGHLLMFNKTAEVARQKGCDYQIWVSKSQDNKKNPLDINTKIFWLKKMFPQFQFHPATSEINTLMKIVAELNKKYKHLILVGGSDRVLEFETLLNAYNGKDYNYDSIDVVSAGERDPDSDGVSGLSASKMRNAAIQDDYVTFSSGMPKTMKEKDIKTLMSQIKDILSIQSKNKKSIKEDVEEASMEESKATEKKIYQVLSGKHPLDIDDVDAIASEAGKLSKSKDIQDKILSHGSDSISVKNRNPLTYSSFLKKLSKLSQNYDNYPRLARHEYVTEEKDEEEELDPVEEYDDHDLEKIANSVTEDDMLDTYHPSEFAIVDDESGEHVKDAEDVREDDLKEDVELLNEMLSRAQRIRRAMLFARTKSKRERALKLALHRTSSSKVIRKRARVAAVIAVKKKLFKGRDLSSLSVQERERAEAIVQRMQRSGALTRLAIKIAPKIRKLEKERLSHSIYTRKD